MRKRIIGIALSIATLCLLCSCAIKTPEELVERAVRQHGKCDLLASSQTDKSNSITVKDKLQGFEYTVVSEFVPFGIDGTYFDVVSTSDDFDEQLYNYVYDSCYTSLKSVCDAAGVDFDMGSYTTDTILTLNTDNESIRESVAEDCAKIIQAYNKNRRLNYCTVSVYDNSGDFVGDVELPKLEYFTLEEKNIEKFSRIATDKIGFLSSFERVEYKHFSDTGLDLDSVYKDVARGIEYDDYENTDFEVAYYYFTYWGHEYYITDLRYYDENSKLDYFGNYPKK